MENLLLHSEYLELGTLILIFIVVWSASFSFINRYLEWKRMRQRLLARSEADATDMESKAELLLGDLTPALAAQVPMGNETRHDLQKELKAAGYYRKAALLEYGAVRTILVVTPLVVAGLLALFVEPLQVPSVLIGGGIIALMGYSIPRIFIYFRAKVRGRYIEQGLPLTIDMLTLCLSAGQNILMALQRVCTEIRFSHPVLADELDIVRQQAELRSLPHALQQWSERVQVDEVRNLTMILIQSERLGTDTCSALLEYSNNLRTNLRQRADAKANKTMFWMLFPTLLCLWIPAAIVLIGPAVLEFQQHRKTAMQQWKSAKSELQNIKHPGASRPDQGQSQATLASEP
jgi:tight adherence protein C